MKKNFKETDFQTQIKHYIDDGNPFPACLCELKVSIGNTITFKSFQPQQIPSCEEAWRTGFYHKLSDASIGLKPADMVYVKDGYVALMFNKNKQQEIGYLLHISHVLDIQETGAKSINIKDCEKLATKLILKKKSK